MRRGVPETVSAAKGVAPSLGEGAMGGPASSPESCDTLCTKTEGPGVRRSDVCSAKCRVSVGSSLTARGRRGGPVTPPYTPPPMAPPPPPPLSSEGVRRIRGTSFFKGRSKVVSPDDDDDDGFGCMGRREACMGDCMGGHAPPDLCFRRTG